MMKIRLDTAITITSRRFQLPAARVAFSALLEKELADTLLVTVVIGQQYQERYKALFFDNHRAYAAQSGYDFRVVDDFLDRANPHPCFISLQKSLVCSQEFSRGYKRIIYVDADILFNLRTSVPVHLETADDDNVYIVDEATQPTRELHRQLRKNCGWDSGATEYYRLAGLEINTDTILNTGLMILNPRLHRGLLEDIHRAAVARGFNHPRGVHFEQAMIGHGLQSAGCYKLLPNEWNAVWMLQKVAPYNTVNLLQFYDSNCAIHFAGNCDIHCVPQLLADYELAARS